MPNPSIPALFLPVAIAFAGGCTPRSVYPPTPGTQASEPWMAPAPEIMATGVVVARERLAPTYAPIYNLPPGVPQWTWEEVGRRIGEGATPMGPQERHAFSVEQIRINGATAEVDVIYPAGEDLFQMVTIGMTTDPFQAWRPTFERRWRVPVSAPTSNWGIWKIQEDVDLPNQSPPPWEADAPR